MANKIIGNLKLRIPAGKATAGPPVGSTLGQWGLNMMDFINPFNAATKDMMGKDVIVHLQVFDDRSFTWQSLGQPVDDMIREKAGIKKGSGKPHTDKVGSISLADVEEIAKAKRDQLNAIDLAGAIKTVAGTARSMGVTVDDGENGATMKARKED
jgi:large subunit ribosomal protein L11